jgi:hypothetical protein
MSSAFPRFLVGQTGGMGTVVLGWDLHRGARWVPPYEQAVSRVALTGPVIAPWHVGGGPVPPPGTRVHLMLQGHTRGLVGRGIVRSAPFRAGPADRPGTLGTHVLIEWDRLRPITDPITCPRLAQQIPNVTWAGVYSDVLEVPDQVGHDLDRLWDAPEPGAVHLPGWVVGHSLGGARTLAGHLSRVMAAHR